MKKIKYIVLMFLSFQIESNQLALSSSSVGFSMRSSFPGIKEFSNVIGTHPNITALVGAGVGLLALYQSKRESDTRSYNFDTSLKTNFKMNAFKAFGYFSLIASGFYAWNNCLTGVQKGFLSDYKYPLLAGVTALSFGSGIVQNLIQNKKLKEKEINEILLHISCKYQYEYILDKKFTCIDDCKVEAYISILNHYLTNVVGKTINITESEYQKIIVLLNYFLNYLECNNIDKNNFSIMKIKKNLKKINDENLFNEE